MDGTGTHRRPSLQVHVDLASATEYILPGNLLPDVYVSNGGMSVIPAPAGILLAAMGTGLANLLHDRRKLNADSVS